MVSGCATGGLESYKTKSDDEALIVAALMKIPNGVKAKSVELMMQAYADDVYVGNFNKYLGVASDPTITRIGKAELRQAYAQVFRSVKDISMEVKDFRLVVQGNRAVAEGNTELLVKVEAGRKEARENLIRNEVTWVLKRGPMGWRVQEEVFR
jgi:ketosteroid isomerase-like protein